MAQDWQELKKFSELTNHASLEDCEDVMLSWKHRGWMEYFCGLYLARYAPEAAAAKLQPFNNDPDWHWAWRFAIEQRERLKRTQHQKILCRSLALLFQRPESGLRPTELMYRAWHLFEFDELLMRQILGDQGQGKSVAELRRIHEEQMKLPGAEAVLQQFRKSSRALVQEMQANTAAQQQAARKLGHERWLKQWQKETSRKKSRTFVPCPPQSWIDEYKAEKRKHDPCVNVMGGEEYSEEYDDEKPPHRVRVAPFALLATPVTRGVYRLFDPAFETSRAAASWGWIIVEPIQHYASPPENASGEEADCDQYPIILTDWYDGWVFCKWLGPEFRLPTECQWEHGCRAGTRTAYHFGDALNGTQANCAGRCPYGTEEEGPDLGRTTLAGDRRYPANAYGLFDVHGQVWEWCWDAVLCRSAERGQSEPAYRDNDVGFRVLLSCSVESSRSSSPVSG